MRAIAAALVILFAAPALATEPAVKLSTSERFPVAGKATAIISPPEADAIGVVYSPGSQVEVTESVAVQKITPPRPGNPYRTAWKPARAGVVALSAGGQTVNVSIRFDGVPAGGVIIMVIAALILFGGAFFSIKSLLSGDG
jgi:hypothetical protein